MHFYIGLRAVVLCTAAILSVNFTRQPDSNSPWLQSPLCLHFIDTHTKSLILRLRSELSPAHDGYLTTHVHKRWIENTGTSGGQTWNWNMPRPFLPNQVPFETGWDFLRLTNGTFDRTRRASGHCKSSQIRRWPKVSRINFWDYTYIRLFSQTCWFLWVRQDPINQTLYVLWTPTTAPKNGVLSRSYIQSHYSKHNK